MPIAEVNGFGMYYRDTGGSGSAVVFIHGGFPSVATLWDSREPDLEPWQRQITDDHRLITLRRRGFHPSACLTGGYAIDDQAADVLGLLDLVAIDSAHVIASSAGGPIAYCLAALQPTRVRSLVLAGTGLNLRRSLRDRPGVGQVLEEQIEHLHRAGSYAASEARPPGAAVSFDRLFMTDEFSERGEQAYYEQRLKDHEDRLATAPLDVRVKFHAAELRAIEAYLAWDGRKEAASIRCPTLLLHGERDRAIAIEEGAELAALIPTAHLEVFPESHSLLWRHEPALVAALRFLVEVDSRHVP
jgi:pimeloyl-ACP methyl ester carboxylesterase